MPQKPVDPDKRRGVQAALIAGVGINEAARRYGVGVATVDRIAKAMGHNAEYSATQRANRAAVAYGKERRAELSNELFDKVREMLGQLEAPSGLKDLVMAFAILTDKRRLEEGEVTDRREYNDPAAIVARGRDRLEALRRAS